MIYGGFEGPFNDTLFSLHRMSHGLTGHFMDLLNIQGIHRKSYGFAERSVDS